MKNRVLICTKQVVSTLFIIIQISFSGEVYRFTDTPGSGVLTNLDLGQFHKFHNKWYFTDSSGNTRFVRSAAGSDRNSIVYKKYVRRLSSGSLT